MDVSLKDNSQTIQLQTLLKCLKHIYEDYLSVLLETFNEIGIVF